MGSKNDLNVFINTGLGLGLSSCSHNQDQHQEKEHHHKIKKQVSLKHDDHLFPSLTLSLSPEDRPYQSSSNPKMDAYKPESSADLVLPHNNRRRASCLRAVSSFLNSDSVAVVKREKEEAEIERVASMSMSSRAISDQEDEEGSPRKKLRLTKQQSATLEDSFKQHSTLNPKQKQVLAAQLNLRPRQVEVWFQNRRARTKLKQTEEDCELLKKCCERLTEENKRLHKELQTLKLTTSLYMQLQPPPPTLTICPCCHERIGGATPSDHRHLFNSLTHPSAAC